MLKHSLEARFLSNRPLCFLVCFESLSKSDWLIFIATNILFELLLGYLWGPVGIVDTFLKIFDVGHFQIHIDLSSISNHTER